MFVLLPWGREKEEIDGDGKDSVKDEQALENICKELFKLIFGELPNSYLNGNNMSSETQDFNVCWDSGGGGQDREERGWTTLLVSFIIIYKASCDVVKCGKNTTCFLFMAIFKLYTLKTVIGLLLYN